MKYSIVKFALLFSFVFCIGCTKQDDKPISPSNAGQWTQINGLSNFNAIIVNGTNYSAATGYGIFLSSDNGINWTKTDSGLTYYKPVYTLIAHQNSSGSTNLFAGTWNGGVFLSTNNGSNWALVNTGLPYRDVACLAIKDSILFAGIGGSGVFLSTNNGSNWTVVNNGLATKDIYCFATSGTNIFAGTSFGVYLSTNNGNNWALADSGLKYTFYNPTPVGALAVSGTNIYAGVVGGKIFLSKDNGTSWTCIRAGQSNEGQSFPCLAVEDSNIFVGTDAGVFHSTNSGTSWTNIDDNLLNTVIVRLFVVNNNIFISTTDGVVWRRSFK